MNFLERDTQMMLVAIVCPDSVLCLEARCLLLERQPKMREAIKILKPFNFEDPIFVECHANEKSKSAALIEPPLS